VRIVDRVAYLNHDIDDAVRAGVVREADLPADAIAVLGPTGSARIDRLVHDLVEHSAEAGAIVQGPEVGEAMAALREWMFDRVYLGERARAEHAKVERVVRTLFEHLCAHPEVLPDAAESDPVQRVVDHVAGMTDRYAMRTYVELTVPRGFAD
jgi:dGTPase